MTANLPALRNQGSVPALIQPEAEAFEDKIVESDVTGSDLVALHGEGWNEEWVGEGEDSSLTASLEQWLGKEAVSRMRPADVAALRRGVAKLPEPEPEDSFVWQAIGKPDDIPLVAEAVSEYRSIDLTTILVADAMGANKQFRKHVKGLRDNPSMPLKDHLSAQALRVENMAKFIGRLEHLQEAMSALFGDRQHTVGAGLVVLAAADGLVKSVPLLAEGFDLSKIPSDDELDVLDSLRRKVVGASDAVRKACQVVPLEFSPPVLSGVRRSISAKHAGDFVTAIEALGGKVVGKEEVSTAGRAFHEYFAAADNFSEASTDLGYTADEEKRLLAHVLLRRHLRSGARTLGFEWSTVADGLVVERSATDEVLVEHADELRMPGLSGKLAAVCKDKARAVLEVRDAAYRLTVEQEFWIEAGHRVLASFPEITLGELIRVIDVEPAISKSRETLRRFGVTGRDEVDPLERHLEWMISAYALPVSDKAINKIIETKAAIIPMRFSRKEPPVRIASA